jgi:CO dehydrogenase maturation factor
MKILICGKGGSGKGTVAALLASAMHKRGKSIFLVDADESNFVLYRMRRRIQKWIQERASL